VANEVTNGVRTPRFFYFDLGNVLLTFDHRRACIQLAQLCEMSVERVWEVLFTSGLQARYEAGEINSPEIYEQFCASSGLAAEARPNEESFHFANSDIFQLNIPVIPIVAHLQAAGYALGILSNTCEAHWRHISRGRFRVLQWPYQSVVLSYEERSSKPDTRIFEAAVRRTGVAPREIFFVDDRLDNVEAARHVGLDAVLFRSPQQLAGDLRSRGVRFNY